jgi:HK97 family phage major capsid protein
MTNEELLEKIKGLWDEMKKSVDEGDAEIKKQGEITGETKAKQIALEEQMVSLETQLKRLPVAGSTTTVIDSDTAEAKAIQRKKKIFMDVLRGNGFSRLGDEEKQIAQETHMMPSMQEIKALSLGDDTAGGFLAPPEYVMDIIKGVQLISPVRSIAKVRPTSRRSIQYPVRSGVFAARWVGETQQRSETPGLSYSMEEITPYEMYAEVLVSIQDLEDTVFDLEAEIRDNAAEQFAKAEGAAFVNGDGAKKPEGYMAASGVTYVPSGQAATIAGATAGVAGAGDPLVTMAYQLKTAYVPGAVWTMTRQSVGAVRKLKDAQGRYIWEPDFKAATSSNGGSLLGFPIVEMPDMPAEAANAFPIALGNFGRCYIIADRVEMVIQRLVEKYAEQGQVAFLVRKRVGGQLVLPEALLTYKCAVS